MELIGGQYTEAKVFAENMDQQTRSQIQGVCDAPFARDLAIRIMPDAYAGKGGVVGTTMPIRDKIVPNIVGVDIRCGMETVKISEGNPDFAKLDNFLRTRI